MKNLFALLCLCLSIQLSAQEIMEVEGAVTIGDAIATTPADGTIKYDGTDFLGITGGLWQSLTSGGGAATPWTVNGSDIFYNGGSVGIGVTSTPHFFHLKNPSNNTKMILDGGTTGIDFIEGNGNFKAYIGHYGGSGDFTFNNNDIGKINFVNNTSSAMMTLTQDQKVGIGETNPTAKLEIESNSDNTNPQLRLEEDEDDDFTRLFFNNTNNTVNRFSIAASLGSSIDHQIGFRYDGAPRLIYNETDKGVGINAANPQVALHIFEPNRDTASILLAPSQNLGKNASITFSENFDNSQSMTWIYEGANNTMKLFGKQNATIHGPHMQITKNLGQIAFGDTFADGYRLSVDGKIMCEELQVQLKADWPDYVFKTDYDLMPLDELKTYIEENDHLPNIPAAAVVESEGIAVGDMQKRMMEKIEELTLYVLDLKDEIELLRAENTEFKK